MKRLLLILIYVLLCPIAGRAQDIDKKSDEETKKEILDFWKCFEEFSRPAPHQKTITLSTGKTVPFLFQSDFKRASFVSVDSLLNDVRQWYESPYLWQLKRQKNNLAISDTKDLTKWEVSGFKDIADSYFKDNDFTFHIAAHGLVESTGDAANCIKIGGQELDAAETAELIIKSMNDLFHNVLAANGKPFVVAVHSCHSADGEDNFASRLSKELESRMPRENKDVPVNNIYVVGAPDLVYCSIDGKKYTEYVTTEDQIGREAPRKENWKVYKNGKNTGQGQSDIRKTIAAVQR